MEECLSEFPEAYCFKMMVDDDQSRHCRNWIIIIIIISGQTT